MPATRAFEGTSLKRITSACPLLKAPKRLFSVNRKRCVLNLDYFPEVSYGALREGAMFTVRERARIVGHGIVIERRPARPARPPA